MSAPNGEQIQLLASTKKITEVEKYQDFGLDTIPTLQKEVPSGIC